MVASDADDARVPQAASLEDRKICRAAADVDERDAELFFIRRQDGFAGGQLLEPARFTQATTFCVAVVPPVTM